MRKNKAKTVFVGLSGGVDSSVSAAILKEQGYNVVGVFIRTWHPDFIECNEEEDRRDAIRVAALLDIPFLTFDFKDEYKKGVADYMINEYKKGRTPNPDVMCNREIKFGAFLKKAVAMGADYIATGHYARIKSNGEFLLCKGKDESKDQAYFLWMLTQAELSKVLFPVGHLKKDGVRKLAKKYKLPVAEKKDSQGICFLGEVDLKDFLKHYIKEKIGKVLNERNEEIGHHPGAAFFTLGERRGFTIIQKDPNDKPYYVVDKDIKKNILFVSHNKEKSISKILSSTKIENTNWISGLPTDKKSYSAQIRYHGEYLKCKIENVSGKVFSVEFEKPVLVAPGQSVVVYQGEIVLGGGVVV